MFNISSKSKMLKIEIEGIDDFVAFVAVIRGISQDEATIKELTEHLNKSSQDLNNAERKATINKKLDLE